MTEALRVIAVAPAKDERGKIGVTVAAFPPGAVDEVLVVDDGSSDGTGDEAAAAGATVLRHERSRGVGAALRTGFDYAVDKGYDVVVVIAGDAQDDPAEVGGLIEPIREGRADYVQGSRWRAGGRTVRIPMTRRVLTQVYSLLFSILTRTRITDATNGYRAFRTRILQDPRVRLHQDWLDTYELEPYLLWKSVHHYRVTEAPVTKRYLRDEGFTKMRPLLDWWRILRPLVLLALRIKR